MTSFIYVNTESKELTVDVKKKTILSTSPVFYGLPFTAHII
jgi:hypothetical protein